MSKPLRVAAIITIYHPWSHADVIATKFMKGMSTDEGFLSWASCTRSIPT